VVDNWLHGVDVPMQLLDDADDWQPGFAVQAVTLVTLAQGVGVPLHVEDDDRRQPS
jgi:hypothetical protein